MSILETSNTRNAAGDERTFEAVLEPNPPLPPKVTRSILGGLIALCLMIGIGFALAGAWPVTGFLGLEVLAFLVAFWLCQRRSRVRERVKIDDTGVTLESVDWWGSRQFWQLSGHWAKASAERQGGQSCLVLRERGKSLSFGRFLNHAENESLAFAINEALQRYRVAV